MASETDTETEAGGYGDAGPLAAMDAGMAANPQPVFRYQMDNHIGSAMFEVDTGGNLISQEEYHPFGTTSYYLGPSAFGIGAAELIRAGHIVAVLWIGLLCLLPVLYLARKSVGIVMVIAASVLLLVLLGAGSIDTQVVTAYAVAWFLLASGVRSVLDDGKAAGDARTLREMTGISRAFWPVLWLAGSVIALIFGATLLV